MRNYTFVKNVKGGLSFTLDSWNMQLPQRTFTIRHNIEQIAIPEDYALGLFISSSALDMYKQGYFVITDFKELKNKASELGLFADEEVKGVVSVKEIEKMVKANNERALDKLIETGSKVELDNLFIIARENFGTLTSGVISKIEKACGAELRIE